MSGAIARDDSKGDARSSGDTARREDKDVGEQSSGLQGPGRGRGHRHAVPGVRAQGRPGGQPRERRPQGAARRDPPHRQHQHLRLRPAHGARPHHGAGGARARSRDHRRGHRGRARTSSSSRSATSSRCRSTSRAGAAATARRARPASASTSTPTGPAARTATSTWAAGSAARPSTCSCPYADWNLLRFPDRDQALEKILDLTMLSDIFPTGFHGAYTAGVGPGLDRVHRRRRTRSGSPPPSARSCSAPPSSSSATSTRSGSRRRGRSAARPSTCRRATRRTRSSRSSAFPRSTAAWTPSASKREDTARMPRTRHPRRCSTRSWRSPPPAARSAFRACTSPATPAASTTPRRSARCRSGSASAGRSRCRSRPGSAR